MFEMHQSTKDLASLCSAICLVFLAYNAVQNLESSAREGVGTTAIGVIYVVAIFSTALAPKLVRYGLSDVLACSHPRRN